MFPPKPLDIFPPEGGCSEGSDAQIFHKQYNVGEKPTVILYTHITLIAMQRHQAKSKNRTETMQYFKLGSNNILANIQVYAHGRQACRML